MKVKQLRKIILLAGLLMATCLVAACGGDDSGDDDSGNGNEDLGHEGESCARKADCADGLRCMDQKCAQVTIDGDTTTDDHGLMWVSIPGGSFQMGCSPNDDECESDEDPRHRVNVSGFKMTKYEVTNAQYAAFLDDRGNNTCSDYPCADTEDEDLRLSESGGSWSADGGYENHPVVEVTWYGAKAFCEAAGGRLPSEAEWEYAARAETTTRFTCGDNSSCLDDIACWNKNDTCPVEQYDPNTFGLYDMLGGVWEWVEDCYHYDYSGAPADGSARQDEECSANRVLRGGSWGDDDDKQLRVSERYDYSYPGDTAFDSGGFRCAQD
jgi:formylglycine-generating enzyme required for sulfatase activity